MPVPSFRAYRPSLVALAFAAACAAAPVQGQLSIVPGPNNRVTSATVAGSGDGGLAGCYHPSGGPTLSGHVSINMVPGQLVLGSYSCSTHCGITTCSAERCFAGLPGSISRTVVSVTGSDTCTPPPVDELATGIVPGMYDADFVPLPPASGGPATTSPGGNPTTSKPASGGTTTTSSVGPAPRPVGNPGGGTSTPPATTTTPPAAVASHGGGGWDQDGPGPSSPPGGSGGGDAGPAGGGGNGNGGDDGGNAGQR